MGKIKRLLDRFDEMGRYPIQELGYSRTWLMFSYLGAFLVHRCTIADYFLYHFYERNRRGRAEFVTLYDMRDIHRKNPQTAFADFEEKDRFLDRFQAYVHRDWIGRVCRNSREEFDAFADRHPRCIIKPRTDSGGHGVHHHSKQPGSGVGAAHLPGYDRRGAAGAVPGDGRPPPQLGEYSPGPHHPGKALLRRPAHGGGRRLCGQRLLRRHFRRPGRGHRHRHPTTGLTIPGFQVPQWEQVRRTVEEAVTLVPNAIIVGWDVAVTAQGPVLIEGNAYPSVQIMQTAGMQGLKRLWNSALRG